MTTIQYELSADDLVEFNHFHHKHSPSFRRRLLASRIGIPLFMIVLLLLTPLFVQKSDQSYLGELVSMKWFFIVPPVLFFYAPFVWERRRASLIRKMLSEGSTRSLLGNCSLTLSNESISIQRTSSLSSYGWEAIDRICVNSVCCYLYVTAVSAIIVPRRAFSSDESFNAFVQEAKQLQRLLKTNPSVD